MIQLFDHYHQGTQDLHDSLLAAGYDCPTIIIEPQGFLPEDMICPYTYFLRTDKPSGQPRYFNQLDLPPYWEVTASNQAATVLDKGEERARIRYADQAQGRFVQQVDWLDRQGHLRLTDRYDRYGHRYAQTAYNAASQPTHTSYYAVDGQERLVENHVTGDIILSLEQEPLRFFKNKTDFLIFFLDYLELDLDHILFNSLATSFLISFQLTGRPGRDILFWQEPLADSLPGNMQLILNRSDLRAQDVIIPDQATYARAQELLQPDQQDRVHPLGYHYQFKRDNFVRKDALILTHSDQVEQLELLLQSLPDLVFRVAALTEMSPKLLSLLTYPNLVLYQNASLRQITELYQQSDIYLDINRGDQVLQALRWAFEHNLLILGFEETAHDRTYLAPRHSFALGELDQLIAAIQQALASVDGMRSALQAQGRHANDLPVAAYQDLLQQLLGGQHG